MTPPKKAAKKTPAAALEAVQPPPEKGIGGRIKEARQRTENDLSIESLSRLCKMIDPVGQGISFQTISRYEKGDVLPGAREIRILCGALNVSADWLIMGKELDGIAQVDQVLGVLSEIIKDTLRKEDPLWFMGNSDADKRSALVAKAKEPQPRE